MSWLAGELGFDQVLEVAMWEKALLAGLPAVTMETFTIFPSWLGTILWDCVAASMHTTTLFLGQFWNF